MTFQPTSSSLTLHVPNPSIVAKHVEVLGWEIVRPCIPIPVLMICLHTAFSLGGGLFGLRMTSWGIDAIVFIVMIFSQYVFFAVAVGKSKKRVEGGRKRAEDAPTSTGETSVLVKIMPSCACLMCVASAVACLVSHASTSRLIIQYSSRNLPSYVSHPTDPPSPSAFLSFLQSIRTLGDSIGRMAMHPTHRMRDHAAVRVSHKRQFQGTRDERSKSLSLSVLHDHLWQNYAVHGMRDEARNCCTPNWHSLRLSCLPTPRPPFQIL